MGLRIKIDSKYYSGFNWEYIIGFNYKIDDYVCRSAYQGEFGEFFNIVSIYDYRKTGYKDWKHHYLICG